MFELIETPTVCPYIKENFYYYYYYSMLKCKWLCKNDYDYKYDYEIFTDLQGIIFSLKHFKSKEQICNRIKVESIKKKVKLRCIKNTYIENVYFDRALPLRMVKKWFCWFRNDDFNLNHKIRSQWPSGIINDLISVI